LLPPVIAALRAQGIDVWGWHYVYGDEAQREAEAAIRRVRALALDGYVIDAEGEYKRPGKAAAARIFMHTLRAGLPNLPVALSSYRYPALHPQLPWREFLEQCDWAMPQVYWERMHNPDQQLARVVAEYANAELVGHVRPVVPTGSAYGAGDWQATPADLTQFLNKAVALKLPAANFYSWDYARAPQRTALWEAVKKFAWPTPTADIVEQWVAALNTGDVSALLRLYHPTAGHVTGRRTVLGLEDLARWYLDLIKNRLPGATFAMLNSGGEGNLRRFTWTARRASAVVASGEDTLGLREGKIQYHYTSLMFAR
jgi:hypothetical protein